MSAPHYCLPTDPALSNGLVGYWKFDEGTGNMAFDYSGNMNHGILVNSPTWVSGVSGSALQFDSSAIKYVIVSSSSILSPSAQVSVSAWVFKTTLVATNDERVVTKRVTGQYVDYILQKFGGTTANQNKMVFSVALSSSAYTTALDSLDIPLNRWVHYVGVYDGTAVRLYRDGTLVASTPATGAINTGTTALRIGGEDASFRTWNGIIDDVRIYNRALSASEIQKLYQGI